LGKQNARPVSFSSTFVPTNPIVQRNKAQYHRWISYVKRNILGGSCPGGTRV